MYILVINPGSTSTKFAVYHDSTAVFCHVADHLPEELHAFANIWEQLPMRTAIVERELERRHWSLPFDAIISRGGTGRAVPGGVYAINERMLADNRRAKLHHACNLGCDMAVRLGRSLGVERLLTADSCVVDELCAEARLTGLPELPHRSVWHALNQRATARRYAREHGLRYEELDLVVCHIGGGISVGAHRHGRAIDTNNGLDGDGPMSPERAGTLPVGELVDLCFSGRYTHTELRRLLVGRGGLVAHLGTSDLRAIEQRIAHGDANARLVVEAMVLQTAKAIAAMTASLGGRPDAILLTGGCARSYYLVEQLRHRLGWMAPIAVYPGENEMDALATNALAVLEGELPAQTYS